MLKQRLAQGLCIVFLGVSAVAAAAPPPVIKAVEPAVVTVGKPHTVTLTHDALTPDSQLFFQPGGPYVKARLALDGAPATLAVMDDLVYAGGDFKGIAILRAAAGSGLQRVGHAGAGVSYRRILRQGQRLYALAAQRLDIFSLQDPRQPRLTGSLEGFGALRELAVAGDDVALLDQDHTLILLETAADAAMPREVARLTLHHAIQAMALRRSVLYLAAGEAGVLALDVRQRRITGQYRTTGPARHLSISGDLALVANGDQGMTILNIADPVRIAWLGSHQQLGVVVQVAALDRERAWALNASHDLLLIDMGNPAMPALISAFPRSGAVTARPLGGHLLLATAGVLALLETAALPPQISNEGLDSGQGVNYGGERKLVIDNDVAYVADWFSGLHLYDISDRRRPRLLSSFHTRGSPKGVVVRNGVAYVADDDHGLQILDVSNPRQPRQLSSLLTAGLAYTPVLAGDLLYLASHRGGFQIVDVKDPARPVLVADVDTPGKSWSIQVRGAYAYVADDDPGLLIFDVQDPASPRLVGRFDPGGAAEDVLLDGDIAYVAFFDRGVYILDISDPTQPRPLRHVPTPGNARGLELDGGRLYVADWLGGIQVLDVTRPREAVIVGGFDTPGASWGLRVHDGFAYVADWWGGFIVLDLSDPRYPRLAGSYHHNDTVRQIATRGMYAYVAKGKDGLQVFDINNPLNPTWVTGVATGPARDVVITGRFAVTCDGGRGLSMVDIGDPFRPVVVEKTQLGHDCDRLRGAEQAVYAADTDGAITRLRFAPQGIETVRADGPALTDLWASGASLFVLGADARIHRYEKFPGVPRTLFTLATKNAARIRAAGTALAIQQPGKGITLLQQDGAQADRAAFIPLPRPVTDMRLEGDRLFVASGDRAILEFTLGGGNSWRLKTRYPHLNPVTRLHVRGNTLYGAGARHITAIATLPDIPMTPVSATTTRADTPADLPNGAYDLVLMEMGTDTPPFVAHNALTLEMPAFGKPSFTLEDLKRVMEQRKAHQEKAGDSRP